MKHQSRLDLRTLDWRPGFFRGTVFVLVVSGVLAGQPLYGQNAALSQPRTAPKDLPTLTQPPVMTSATGEQFMDLTLEETIRLGLQQNLNIKRERLSPHIASTIVEQARSDFDPIAALAANLSETKVLPVNQTQTVDPNTGEVETNSIELTSRDGEVTPRLQQKVLVGSTYELAFVNTRSDLSPSGPRIVDPRYESSVELTLTQPLLRDFGIKVNTTFIRQAQEGTDIAKQQLLQTILDIVFAVQQRYWELVFRIRNLEANRAALKLAEDFLADNKVRVELKVLAPIELVQSETQVKQREGDIILAQAAVEDAEDLLKEALNIPGASGTWKLHIRPTDAPPFDPVTVPPSIMKETTIALANRPDLIQSRLDISSRMIGRDFARNQLLPRLDIVGQGSLDAFGKNSDKSLGNLDRGDGYQWFIGLQVEYPLGNRFARNRLQQRNLEVKQAVFDNQILELSAVRQLRQAIRDIGSTSMRVGVTRTTTALAQAQLEAEQEKFRVGLSNSFRILSFQNDLTFARIEEIRTITNYNIALGRLDQVTGTLRYGAVTARLR